MAETGLVQINTSVIATKVIIFFLYIVFLLKPLIIIITH